MTLRRTPSCRERSLVDGRRERSGSRPPTIAARRLACTGAGLRFSSIVTSGRTAQLRKSAAQEINATSVITMDIERASAKIRAKGVADDDEDYLLPIYAERLPIHTVIGTPEPCPRLHAGVDRPQNLAGYRAGRPLEEAVAEAHVLAYQG
jgi:hypothetical protein